MENNNKNQQNQEKGKDFKTVQNTNNTNKNASVTVQRKEQPKQNTLELFVITILVTILILFFVGIVHKDLKI